MMKYVVILLISILAMGSVHAGEGRRGNDNPVMSSTNKNYNGNLNLNKNRNSNVNRNLNANLNANSNKNYNDNSNSNRNSQSQKQGQAQGQAQGQGQVQGNYGHNSVKGNTNNVNIAGDDYEASVIAPNLGGLPSGNCTGRSGGATVGFPLFAAGLQGAGIDQGCDDRENARSLLNHAGSGAYDTVQTAQMKSVAFDILMNTGSAKRALARMEAGESPDTALIEVEEVEKVASAAPRYVSQNVTCPSCK